MSSIVDVAMALWFCGSIKLKPGQLSVGLVSVEESKLESAPAVLFGIAIFLMLSHMANLSYLEIVDFYLARLLDGITKVPPRP